MSFLKLEEVKKLCFCLSEDGTNSILKEAKQILVGVRRAHSACPLGHLCGHASSMVLQGHLVD